MDIMNKAHQEHDLVFGMSYWMDVYWKETDEYKKQVCLWKVAYVGVQ